ncbi:hypothetical protein KP509_38G054900 [Ceratopteris richardii]|uniref:Uncharacterized protein n=1 Tax=Ceratopteris richardii TaxID=49495 RepID=A0A8T2Q4R0_CERRI|nr:hypothetical protein KP509_38G054900 [Ceratopteris richardii]
MEAGNGDVQVETLQTQIEHLEELWKKDATRRLARETLLKSELLDVRTALLAAESNGKNELDLLRHRIKTADTLLSYLNCKARILTIPRFAHTSCGIRRQEGVGLVDKKGVLITQWKDSMNPAIFDQHSLDPESQSISRAHEQSPHEEEHVESIARTVMQVTDVMEFLLKRAILAEADVDVERQKARASQDEAKQKSLQLESMQSRVQEMEKVAVCTSSILKKMQLKLGDMEQETSRQQQRAAENEQELSRVRHDFRVLRSRIEILVTSSARTIVNLEKRIEEMEGISERYFASRFLSIS